MSSRLASLCCMRFALNKNSNNIDKLDQTIKWILSLRKVTKSVFIFEDHFIIIKINTINTL